MNHKLAKMQKLQKKLMRKKIKILASKKKLYFQIKTKKIKLHQKFNQSHIKYKFKNWKTLNLKFKTN